MGNFNMKLDLSKLKNACIKDLKGASGMIKCLIIPVADNNLFISEKTGSVYLDCECKEVQNPKYDQTHFVKRRYTKEQYYQMDADDRKNIPIIGNLSPMKEGNNNNNSGGYNTQSQPRVQPSQVSSNNSNDLPF